MLDPDAPSKSDFSLPGSGLFVEGRELVKRDLRKSAVVARIPIDRITQVELTKELEPIAIVFCMIFAGGAWASWAWIPGSVLRWIAAGVLGGVSLLSLVGARSLVLEVRSQDGTARYDLADPEGHAQGFLVTLKGMKRPPGA
jgi:hypothetical protein